MSKWRWRSNHKGSWRLATLKLRGQCYVLRENSSNGWSLYLAYCVGWDLYAEDLLHSILVQTSFYIRCKELYEIHKSLGESNKLLWLVEHVCLIGQSSCGAHKIVFPTLQCNSESITLEDFIKKLQTFTKISFTYMRRNSNSDFLHRDTKWIAFRRLTKKGEVFRCDTKWMGLTAQLEFV